MQLVFHDYVIVLRVTSKLILKIKKLFNNSLSYLISSNNYNSLDINILNKVNRNKEIIKVNIIFRTFKRFK
jgi:hypothetical protein